MLLRGIQRGAVGEGVVGTSSEHPEYVVSWRYDLRSLVCVCGQSACFAVTCGEGEGRG